MHGLYQRKGSAKWQGRFRIPDKLWQSRDKLIAMGFKVQGTQDNPRSTGEDNKSHAMRKYRTMLNEFETMLEAWEDALVNGPRALNHPDTISLAAKGAHRLLEEHRAEPSGFPDKVKWSDLPNIDKDLSDKISQMSNAQVADYSREAGVFKGLTKGDKLAVVIKWLRAAMDGKDDTPIIPQHLKDFIESGLKLDQGADVDDTLKKEGVEVAPKSHLRLLLNSVFYQQKARDTNQERLSGAYSKFDPEWYENAPKTLGMAKQAKVSGLTFEDVIFEEIKRRKKGVGGHALGQDAIERFNITCSEYSTYSGSSLVQDVTLQKASAWRDTMLDKGKLSNRTISHRVSALKTVIKKSINHAYTPPLFPNGSPLVGLTPPSYKKPLASDLTYTLSEGRSILEASRNETKPDRRWLPWLLAYSGARANEAARLRKDDFREVEGVHCYNLREDTDRGRTIKTASSVRTVPLHSAIIDEGFLDYLGTLKENDLLFPKSAATNVRRWIRKTWPDIISSKKPNHAWRHLFRDLCDRYEVDRSARLSIMGHTEGGVTYASDGYGGSDVRMPGIKKQLEKIEPYC